MLYWVQTEAVSIALLGTTKQTMNWKTRFLEVISPSLSYEQNMKACLMEICVMTSLMERLNT